MNGHSSVKYRDWEFEVDFLLTQQAYQKFPAGGSDTCNCSDCKNYSAYKNNVFPEEIKKLFIELGVDFKKEVEIWSIHKLGNGFHKIAGWFHFKGKIISGVDCRKMKKDGNGYTTDLTSISENFEIGFTPGSDLTFFDKKDGLIQIEFIADIPWVIEKSLEAQ
jgi:hypothetical protein